MSAQKWAWTYFSMTEKETPSPLEVTASGARSTGSLAAPDLAGKAVGFSYQTGLIGLIPRNEDAGKIWDQWAALGNPAPAEVTIGTSLLINDRFAMRDATITRADGSGEPIAAPEAWPGRRPGRPARPS